MPSRDREGADHRFFPSRDRQEANHGVGDWLPDTAHSRMTCETRYQQAVQARYALRRRPVRYDSMMALFRLPLVQ